MGLLLATLLAATPLPALSLQAPSALGCGTPSLLRAGAWLALEGGPSGLCATALFAAHLEDGAADVVVLVQAAHRFDAEIRTRLFIYRLEGARLVPRFLGSGFSAVDVVGAERIAGAPLDSLRVWTAARGAPGSARVALRCGLVHFPLQCEVE